jgi:hypothetical protein
MAGYSGTPLSKKLGIKADAEVLVVNEPQEYQDWLAPLPEGVKFATKISKSTDVIHLFVTSRKKLDSALRSYRKKIKPDAVIWVSWPKKASKVETDIVEDTIRELALPMGYVDTKVCAVSEMWSGLKLVIRKELR